tara:strand:+ start:517 stop:804 length:288 start_codon:yes stop_codon:yes gene_type:complete
MKSNYKAYTPEGLSSSYHEGDIVRYKGRSFEAKKDSTGELPTQTEFWEELAYSVKYTSGTNPHSSPQVGDKWFDTSSGKLYTYIDAGTSNQWVEI